MALQTARLATLILSLTAGLALAACAGAARSRNDAATSAAGNSASARPAPAASAAPASAAPAGVAQRELTPEEKKAIMDAVGPSIKDPGSAKYHWVKFSAMGDGSPTNYCATVDAKSPYPPYDGHQAYIVEVQMLGGRVNSAIMDLIAGGKDTAIVSKMCAKYGLDPNKSS